MFSTGRYFVGWRVRAALARYDFQLLLRTDE
jgi:hypothetical protein